MTSKEAYRVLVAKRARFDRDRAFFETARELGISPSDLGRLFARSRKSRRAREEETEQQGLLFS